MIDCIICGHGLREHHEDGCQHHGAVRSHCGCSYVQLPPLPHSAGGAEHRARSDWWDGQARIARDLASASKGDLDRWYPLMRFHRAARRAELDHRRYAESLMAPSRHSRSAQLDGSAEGEDLAHAAGDGRGRVAHRHDGIGTGGLRRLDHHLGRLVA